MNITILKATNLNYYIYTKDLIFLFFLFAGSLKKLVRGHI